MSSSTGRFVTPRTLPAGGRADAPPARPPPAAGPKPPGKPWRPLSGLQGASQAVLRAARPVPDSLRRPDLVYGAAMYQYQPPPPPPQDDGGATASMVLGILGLVLCGLLSPIALFMGISAKRRIRESGGYLGGEGQATPGIVMGAIGTAFIVIPLLIVVIAIIVAATASHGTG